MNKTTIAIFLFLLYLTACNLAENDGSEYMGKIHVIDSMCKKYINPKHRVEVLGKDFKWADGPVWIPSRNKLLFNDVAKNTIYEWKEELGVSEFLQPSGYTSNVLKVGNLGANGMVLNREDKLILCQHGDRRIAKLTSGFGNPIPNFHPLIDKWNGKKFNSPNDLILHKNGTVYFTDPPLGLEMKGRDKEKELKFNGVFILKRTGEIFPVERKLKVPNGIAFSPDYKKCYISNSQKSLPVWKEYLLNENGNLTKGKLLFNASHLVDKYPGLPDGIKVNRDGILFTAGPGGILLINKEGIHIATIQLDQVATNCAFDENEDYLYITMREMVGRIKLRQY